jgi:hypothetical protein
MLTIVDLGAVPEVAFSLGLLVLVSIGAIVPLFAGRGKGFVRIQRHVRPPSFPCYNNKDAEIPLSTSLKP